MVSSGEAASQAFQDFKGEDSEPLQQMPVQICSETGLKCIFWKDVKNTFQGVDCLYGTVYVTSRVPRIIMFMFGQNGEVLHPLRIEYAPDAYLVNYSERQEQLPTLELQYRYYSWVEKSKDLEKAHFEHRHYFLLTYRAAENSQSKLLEQFEIMNDIGIRAEVDGKTKDQILDELQEYRQYLTVWDYENACHHVLQDYLNCPAPGRFLVLPADLESWDDLNPTTHNFRLYFLCDVTKDETNDFDESDVPGDLCRTILPQHKHLSNHAGFDLVRPQEFFQTFGSYILMILRMVRQGFSDDVNEIPPLDNFGILWGFDLDGSSSPLTKDTIGPLVSKAISYLEGLSLPLLESEIWLNERQSVEIKDFLVVPSGSNTLGGLYRRTTTLEALRRRTNTLDRQSKPFNSHHSWTWTCKQHAHQWLTPGIHEALEDFVYRCGGHVDLQLATISIRLESQQQADIFCNLLKNSEQRFQVSITLGWNEVSRQGLDEFLLKIIAAEVQLLELDGVPHGDHLQQGIMGYRTEFFATHLAMNPGLLSLTLLNYPGHQEQCTYVTEWTGAVCKIHSKQKQSVKTAFWRENLRFLIDEYVNVFVGSRREECSVSLRRLKDLLAKAGYQAGSTVSSHRNNWCAEFDLQEGILRSFQVYDLSVLDMQYINSYYYTLLVRPVALQALESLRMLIVDVNDLKIDHEIACMVRASPMLRELNISLRETRTLERVEKTLEIWHGRIGSLQLTLLERGVDGRGRSVCQAIVRGDLDRYLGGASVALQGSNALRADSQEWRKGGPANIEFMQWSSDHVSAPLADPTAVLLDMGTEYNPSVLTSLVLDISNLSQDGWASVHNILQRSMLGNLHIVCTTFDPSLNDFVRQVLLSVQWSALQSLVVSGEAVNKWIQLLATVCNDKATMITPSLQLQCFRVQGSGKQLVRLSHSSVLFVHQLVYLNPAMELILENACLQDDRDTDLLR